MGNLLASDYPLAGALWTVFVIFFLVIFLMILFSIFGYAAYRWGKNTSRRGPYWIGIALMVYPYFISNTWLMYGVGVALCASLLAFRH